MSGIYTGPGSPTHGIASTYRSTVYACRCQPCRDANAALQRKQVTRRAAVVSDAEVQHGSVSTYINWGCRCDECKAAHSANLARQREARFARMKADPTIRPHGTMATYSGWGCRCEACVAAATTYKRLRSYLKERAS